MAFTPSLLILVLSGLAPSASSETTNRKEHANAPVPAKITPGQTAAEIDWRPLEQLPESQRANVPVYCDGGYLQPRKGASGQADPFAGGGSDAVGGDAPLHASGLSARYELDSRLTLDGDVRLRQGNFTARGSRAEYDQPRGKMTLRGPIVSRGDGFLMTGESARYDTGSRRFDVDNATFLIHQAEMRGEAESLTRPDDNLVNITAGRLTTCSPDSNAWALVASDIELNRAEGFGTATHIRLEVKDIPVFYWPYGSFPIDDRRKTGFLYPTFGSSNVGRGLFFSAPYYLNLAPDYDATVTPQYIHGRGLFNEIEGRYLSDYGESVLQLGYIDNDQDYADDNAGEDGRRWGLDFYNRSRFGGGWSGYVDYSAVSDEDYLSDLNRTLEITETTHLLRTAGVRYAAEHQFFEGYLNGYQTLNEDISLRSRPYRQLPELIYGFDQQWGVFETLLESQYTYFTRDNDGLTGLDRAIGHRLRALPEVALNFRALWGYARPSATLNHTQYALDDYTAGDGDFSRTIPVYEWDSGLYFDRQSSLFDIPYNQSLEPRLYYAYSEAKDQSDIPDFDTVLKDFSFDQLFSPDRFSGGDRVADNNQLAAAITTRFNDLYTGIERARLSIGQLYYYDDREVTLAGRGGGMRSDSPLAGEAVLRPLETLDIRASGVWDPRSNKTEIGRSQLVYHSPDYRYLATIGHSYDRDDFEQMDIGTVFPVSDHISLIGRYVYDSEADRTVGSLAGIEYTNCCWSMQLVSQNYFTRDRTLEQRVVFQIQLKGLGTGGGVGGRVSDAIYGFEERESRRFGNAGTRY